MAATAATFGDAVAGAVAQDVACRAIIKATSATWNSNTLSLRRLKKKTSTSAIQKTAFGFSDALDRHHFAMSPISRVLSETVLATGRVHVAYVPPGLGKTTACRIFLTCSSPFKYGIAFCPATQGDELNYLSAMCRFLQVDPDRPPEGWLAWFFKVLEKLDAPVVVMLDDYMASGVNKPDSDLCFAIKSLIRSTKITVIVLTQNKDSANHLLELNGWMGIVPVLDHRAIVANRAGNRAMDWDVEFNMQWSLDSLVEAVFCRNDENRTRDEIRCIIGGYLASMTAKERNQVGPSDIQVMLQRMDVPARAQPPGNAVWERDEPPTNTCDCSETCAIL